MVLGMTGRLAAELAEVADIVERDRGLPKPLVLGVHGAGAGQVQHRPQQHRGVTVGEHEAIAVRPDRILRIEAHDPVPERVDERRQRHRRAGMAGLRLLNRIDRQRANAIDRQLIQLRSGHRSRRIHCGAGDSTHFYASILRCVSSCCGRGAIGKHQRADPDARASAGIDRSPSRRRTSACGLLAAGHQPQDRAATG